MNTGPLVSVVVPVYNVEAYVSRCIESLLMQTYSHLEILLIDDGSQDGSLEILKRCEKQDARLRIFHKENEGLGPTRNYGLHRARGEYIMYVDSDDYVLPTIVEKLLDSLLEHQADISVCDWLQLVEGTQFTNRCRNAFPKGAQVVPVQECPDILTEVSTMAWGKLYKRAFLLRHDIEQPPCVMEDVITYVTLALADRISYVPEPLYIYLVDREGSITHRGDFINTIEPHRVMIGEFQKRGLDGKYEEQLQYLAAYRGWLKISLAKRRQAADWTEMEKQIDAFANMLRNYLAERGLDKGTGWEMRDRICMFGSYGLSNALKKVLFGGPPLWGYSFSSLISAMSPPPDGILDQPLEAENPYRRSCLAKDLYKTLLLTGREQVRSCKAVLLDFLEERYPVGRTQDGAYITVSDALRGSNLWGKLEVQELAPFSEAFMILWREKCDSLITLLENRYPDARIILVKMFLTEAHGTPEGKRVLFAEDWIATANRGLVEMYDYFIQHCKRAEIVEIPDELFYTDDAFRHGCDPWHVNEEFYQELGGRIERCLLSK